METGLPLPFNLDDLSAKLRKKEFKSKAKEMRSKDNTIRMAALDRVFQDPRYLLEGECIVPFFEMITPNKKALDASKDGLIRLLALLKSTPLLGADSSSVAILNSLHEISGDYNALSVLANIAVFRLDLKIKKRDNAVECPNYSEMECSLRSLALEALHTLFVDASKSSNPTFFLTSFAALPLILETLDIALCLLVSTPLTAKKEKHQQEIYRALQLINFVLLHRATPSSLSPEAFQLLPSLATDDLLTAQALHVLLLLLDSPVGAEMVLTQPIAEFLISTLDAVIPKLLAEPVPVVVTKGKGKSTPVKESKKDKLAAMGPQADKAFDANDFRRTYLLITRLLISAFSKVVARMNTIVAVNDVTKLVQLLVKMLGSQTVWELVRSPTFYDLDVDTNNTVLAAVVLLGELGGIVAEFRRAACGAGGANALLTLLLQSHTAAGCKALIDADEKEKRLQNLCLLRCSIEQSILCLLSGLLETNNGKLFTWASCQNYKTDWEMWGENSYFDVHQLVDGFNSEDTSLGNHCLRTFTALIESLDDKGPFLAMSAAFVPKLSAMLLTRSQQTILHMLLVEENQKRKLEEEAAAALKWAELEELNKASKLLDVDGKFCIGEPSVGLTFQEIQSPTEMDTVDGVLSEIPVKDVAIGAYNMSLLESRFGIPLSELVPSPPEALALLLISLEPFLKFSAENVNALDLTTQFKSLSELIFILGPTGVLSVNGSSPASEFISSLHDVRGLCNKSSCFLRELIFRVMTAVAGADRKYKTFAGLLPVQPGSPSPEFASPCLRSAVNACSEFADACIATALSESRWSVCNSNLIIVARENRVLVPEVLDAALQCWQAMATTGTTGLYSSIVSAMNEETKASVVAEQKSSMHSALKSVRECVNECLQYIPGQTSQLLFVREAEIKGKEKAAKQASTKASISPFFDKIFPLTSSSLPTSVEHLSDNAEVWAYLTHAAAVLGVLSSTLHSKSTCEIAMSCVLSMTQFTEFTDFNQPFVADIYSAAFLCLGGAVILSGCIGRLGSLEGEGGDRYQSLLKYLANRGAARESYWAERVPIVDPKAKSKSKAVAGPKGKGDSILGIVLPTDPDSSHPDPNHGPGSALWTQLLSVRADDAFSVSSSIGVLSASLIHGLDELAEDYIIKKIGLEEGDSLGKTPTMYALLLKQHAIARALIEQAVNVNAFDNDGNPLIKYAFLSTEEPPRKFKSQIQEHSVDWKPTFLNPLQNEEVSLSLIQLLIEKDVDLRVSDSLGNGPLHYAVGLVKTSFSFGGNSFLVHDHVYEHNFPSLKPLLKLLCAGGADSNAGNMQGQVPLHILAALSDTEAIEYLLSLDSTLCNPMDSHGCLPLHYALGAARPQILGTFKLLLHKGSYRPVHEIMFCNPNVTGMSKAEKEAAEMDRFIERSFAEALSPTEVCSKRLRPAELLSRTTSEGQNLVELTLSGYSLEELPFYPYANDDISLRQRVCELLYKFLAL